ncbi:MAG: prolyl oligopeptidase family serine peptidase [Phycisphaerae bacterium]|nr:prolyl oligopeptidase family serine peptidase [Phycisphaerae bacterium]
MNKVFLLALSVMMSTSALVFAQEDRYAVDRGLPGDAMIQTYLNHQAARISGRFLEGTRSLDSWQAMQPRLRQEYLYMLGLWPLPERTALKPVIRKTIDGKGFAVDLLHFQSRPGLYVTANLYRPAVVEPGRRLPTVLYVCGHSARGRDGVKTAYQSHGIWYARHGYVCLVLDTLQLGEIASVHHGTYREKRWWWHSRGYTPAGVECWNGMRAIDYLVSRDEVDPSRIAVTGISGGGASTFWIAAADERVAVAVPVSGMADLTCYVGQRLVNGHCDCMFFHNVFQWPWTYIAALIAPRPLLFVNSDQDRIFPMSANERIINRLERLYSLFEASDRVDAVVSVGGHEYRKDIRQASYRFINSWLKGESALVEDSEVDLVNREEDPNTYPIPASDLRVFPEDSDIPADQINTTVDRVFVPMAVPDVPPAGGLDAWRERLVRELRRVSFSGLPERIPPARVVDRDAQGGLRLATEPGIECFAVPLGADPATARQVLIVVAGREEEIAHSAAIESLRQEGDVVFRCEPRGVGGTRWTQKGPPNYVLRAHALLGRSIDAGRVWDVIATARFLATDRKLPVRVAGVGAGGVLAAYAALLEPEIAGVAVSDLPASHMDEGAPQLLNVLRVCDIPDALGMLAPRPLRLHAVPKSVSEKVKAVYSAGSVLDRLSIE